VSIQYVDSCNLLSSVLFFVAVTCREINRFYKEIHMAAQVGGLEWTDFSFDVVDCGDGAGGDAKPMAVLTKELKTLLANLAVDKLVFKTWLSTVQIIPVPTENALPETQMDALRVAYADMLDILYEPSVGVSAIVYAMAETVVKLLVKPAPTAESRKKTATAPPVEVSPQPPKVQTSHHVDILEKLARCRPQAPMRSRRSSSTATSRAFGWPERCTNTLPNILQCSRESLGCLWVRRFRMTDTLVTETSEIFRSAIGRPRKESMAAQRSPWRRPRRPQRHAPRTNEKSRRTEHRRYGAHAVSFVRLCRHRS
jgi:hypothetical protein